MVLVTKSSGCLSGGLVIKGNINTSSNFPTLSEVKTGRTYRITADVTDSNPSKTNTGLSFRLGDIISRSGGTWVDITGLEVWLDTGTEVHTLNVRDINVNGMDVYNIDKLSFDITPTSSDDLTSGQARWNSTDSTIDLGLGGGVTQQIGQELFIKVINKTGSKINNGTVVYFNGRQGNRPKIYKAMGNVESTSCVRGVTTEDIEDNNEGFITTFGYVRQIKTDYSGSGDWGTTRTEGDRLYLSKTVAGQLTNIEPTSPHHSDIVGEVGIIGGAGIGSIFVDIKKHQTLEELSDVNGTELSVTGQIPVRDNENGFFDFNYNIVNYFYKPGILGGQVAYGGNAAGNSLTLSSTSNSTKGTIIFGSSVYDEVNNRLGIGTSTPTNSLSFGGDSARIIWLERNTISDTAGNNLTIQAGGATSGSTNKGGGALILSSGVATGTNSSTISFQTCTSGISGTADNTIATRMSLSGHTNGRLHLGGGALSDSQDGYNLYGTVARYLYMARHTTADTAGNNLTVQAGGCTSGATNKNGGNLLLTSGISTGTGSSNVFIQVYRSGGSGTSDSSLGVIAGFYGSASSMTLGNVNTLADSKLGINMTGNAGDRNIYILRHTTADTAGAGLLLQAGGATSGATNKNGGNLTISSGISTGNGFSRIAFATVAPNQGAGTTDRNPVIKGYFMGDGGFDTLRGSYFYHAQTLLADTVGDWRTYADASGYYVQYCTVANATKGAGTWVTKQQITI